jgi:hypothetical protein
MATNNAKINVQVVGQQQVDKLTTSISSLNSKFQGLGNAIKGLAFGTMLTQMNKLNESLVQASRASEVTLESVAAFSKAVSLAGGNAERAAGDIIDFVAGLTAAKQGSADAQAELAAVGITLQDLANLTNEALFQKTIDGLLKINDASLRNQLSVRLLGKSFKDLDIRGVGESFRALSGSINVGAIQASADAQKNLAKQFGNLTTALTNVLEPLNKIASGISISVTAFESLIKAVGLAVGSYLIFAKALPALVAGQNAVITGLKNSGGAFTFLKNVIMGVLAGPRAFFLNMLRGFGILQSGLPVMGSLVAAFGGLAKGALRLLGVVGVIYSIAEAVNFLSKQFFNFDILDWIGNKFKEFGQWVGIIKKPAEEVKKSTEEAGKKEKERASIVKDAHQKIRDELAKTVNSYKLVNEEQLRTIKNDIDLIGKTEDYKAVREALFDAETKYLTQINGMLEKYYELQAAAQNTEAFSKENAEFDAYKKTLTEGLTAITRAYESQIPAVTALMEAKALAIQADNLRLFAIDQETNALNKLRDVQHEIATITMTQLQKKYADIRFSARKAAEEAIRTEEIRRGALMSEAERTKYLEAANAKTEELIAKEGELYNKSREFSTGWKTAFNQYVEDATNAAKQAERIFSKLTQGLEDAFVNFAKTGKLSFKDLLNSIVEDLLRSQIRQLLAQTFSIGGTGGGGGNIFSSIGKLLGFANGGIIPTNQPVLVGERGPEILTGAGGRTVIPNNALGGGQSVTYNINAVDAASFKAMIARDPSFIHAVATQGGRMLPQGRR